MLKFGIIGLSSGNGHPYSWSAIFNGYNKEFMNSCPYPAIPEYLSKQNFPEDTIKNAKVTHIWTQDIKQSEHVAKSSNINCVVEKYTDFIGKVDAVLLARDDYQTHYEISKPFIENGLPIYIDKPFAASVSEACKIFELEKFKNQIFTCSALRFAKELQLDQGDLASLGDIQSIDAVVPKTWELYGIHVIEPVLNILTVLLPNLKMNQHSQIKKIKSFYSDGKKFVWIDWNGKIVLKFCATGDDHSPIAIKVLGKNGTKNLEFKDSFNAFKNALLLFVDVVNGLADAPSKDFVLDIVKIIELGTSHE